MTTKAVMFIKITVASIGGLIARHLGGLDFLLKALIIFIVLDYISGVMKAFYSKNLSSNIGLKGIVKKIYLLILVAVAFVIEQLVGGVFPLREVAILFFIANEGLSILENSAAIGVPIPKQLKNALQQIKSNTIKKGAADDSETDITHE